MVCESGRKNRSDTLYVISHFEEVYEIICTWYEIVFVAKENGVFISLKHMLIASGGQCAERSSPRWTITRRSR